MIGARAGAASTTWLMAARKQGLEGKAGNKQELSLHSRAMLGAMRAQGSSHPEKGGEWHSSAHTEIGAARNLSPCLAVRSGSTNATWAPGRGRAGFSFAVRECRDGLTSAPWARLGSALLPVPDPQASQDWWTAHVGFTRARHRNNSRQE